MKKSIQLSVVIFILLSIIVCTPISAQQNALNFDGVDDYASVPNASSTFVGGSGISMSCWVYPTNANSGFPNFDGMCGFRNESNADFYLLQLNSTSLEARYRNSTGTHFTISYTGLQLNTWQHYVLTFDGSNLNLYKDGALASSIAASGSFSSTTETFYIGKSIFQVNNFMFTGSIDEVALWDKALNLTEIGNIYGCGASQVSTNLKHYFDFNQGVAGGSNTGLTTINNAAGTVNATMSNFALSGNTSNWVSGVQTAIINNTSASVCEGDTFWYNGMPLTIAGIYSDTFPTLNCDSIVSLTLSLDPGFHDTSNLQICEGDTAIFHGNMYTQIGFYDVNYPAANCDSVYTLNLSYYPPPATFLIVGSQNVVEQQVYIYAVPATTGITYDWSVIGGTIIDATNNTYIEVQWGNAGVGAVNVAATSANGCLGDTITLPITIGVNSIDNPLNESISVYPNPANEMLFVDYSGLFQGKLYDIQGRLVKQFSTEQVDISDINKGIYSIVIENRYGKRILNKQVVIQ